MNESVSKLSRVMDSALEQGCTYLESEFDLHTSCLPPQHGEIDTLLLRELTAIVGIGGTIDLYVAFSFEETLIQALYERMTEGMAIGPEEEEELKQATAGEIVNIIVGHCTTDLQNMDSQAIPITPPTVLNLVKIVPRLKNAIFHLRSVSTSCGTMNVYLIGPRELFSNSLDYIV